MNINIEFLRLNTAKAIHDISLSSNIEKARKTTPRFLIEGYALYEGGDYITGIMRGQEVKVKKTGFDFIGVKPDAPEWAKQEYEEWISY